MTISVRVLDFSSVLIVIFCFRTPPIKFLGISAGKFSESGRSFNTVSLDNYFKSSVDKFSSSTSKKEDKDVPEASAVVNDILKPSNIIDNKLQTKNTSGSFFEKFLREKSKKLPENEITKRNCMYFEPTVVKNKNDCHHLLNLNNEHFENNNKLEKQNENYKTEMFIDDINKNLDLFSHDRIKRKESNEKCDESVSKEASTSYSNATKDDSSNESKMDCSSLSQRSNGNDNMWVSPSEIFPDMNNIDDNVLQLLPSPMQRKISSSRKNITNENSNDSNEVKVADNSEKFNDTNNQQSQDKNRFSLMSSTSSECAPTILETVACVHTSDIQESKSILNSYNLKFNFGNQESKPATSLNTSSIDIFTEENEPAETSSISEECPHCKEKIWLQDFPEHLDHHIAMDLHKQLNPLEQKNKTENQSNAVSNKKKRSRTNKKEAPIPHKKTRTIASFFTRR